MNKEEILTCKMCNQLHDDLDALDQHLKLHKIKKEEYYRRHYPKKDLFTGQSIKFTSSEFYLTSLFNDKNSLRAYFKRHDDHENTEISLRLIKARLNFKDITFIPCQVETRSLVLPGTSTMLDLFDYEEKMKDFGLKKRFSYDLNKFSKLKSKPFNNIIIDTREKKPLIFKRETVLQKLDQGDYSRDDDQSLCIERKSLTDFVSTLSGNYDRFLRELDGAKKERRQIVVLVELKLTDCLSFNHIPYYKKLIKATPVFIFHRVRSIIQNYKNVQFLFVDGRKEASLYVEKLLSYGKDIAKFDLQFLYDKKHFKKLNK